VDGTFIGTIVFGVLTLVGVVVWLATRVTNPRPHSDQYDTLSGHRRAVAAWELRGTARRAARWTVIALGGCTVLLFTLSCFTRVGTNQIGIMNSFGRPVDALSNGVHPKSPWETKVEFDASRQFLRFQERGNGKETHSEKVFPAFKVRIANNAGAEVWGVVTWQMRADTPEEKLQAVQLYRQYRTFERLNDNYVAQSTQAVLLATFADVNPLVPDKNPSFAELSVTTERHLRELVGAQLDVISVQLTFVDYDDKTDDAIKSVQAQIAKTAEETQRQKTNEAAARAAAALGSTAQGPPPSEAVLINKCLDIAQALGKEPGYCFIRGATPIIGRSPQ
jgi:hypothetical protein